MQTITVKQGQSIIDIAIIYTGDATSGFDIANLNGLAITDVLTTGQQLFVPDVIKKNIVTLFDPKNQPATDVTQTGEPGETPEGISYWIVNKNFIVQ